jgi:flagellar protein FliO/FliZ
VGGTAPLLFAAPSAHPVMAGQAGSLIRVVIALLLVLAAVFAAAWFSRRMHGVGNARNSTLEVLAQLSLGPRERAVLVRVGSQQVLLGVASGNVRALHVLPEGAPVADATPLALQATQRPSFKAALLRSLGK